MKSLRIRLFLSHLAISAAVIGTCVAFVLLVWYPPPLAQIEEIASILFVMVGVDVCAGPLCTLVAASPKKTRGHLVRDLAVIAAVQLLALGYGLYTTCIARPAFVVYSVGVFEIEHANELTGEELAKAAGTPFSAVPLLGPVYVEAVFPESTAETMRIANSAIAGGPDIKDMPRYFQPWPSRASDAREKAKPYSSLPEAGALRQQVSHLLKTKGVSTADAIVLPISGKAERGTVVLRKTDLSVLGIIPYLAP
jgi:hypothetical protein